eukprot:SAG22_NODE_19080_length_278_cov_0.849162_1_plen_92_part_11
MVNSWLGATKGLSPQATMAVSCGITAVSVALAARACEKVLCGADGASSLVYTASSTPAPGTPQRPAREVAAESPAVVEYIAQLEAQNRSLMA